MDSLESMGPRGARDPAARSELSGLLRDGAGDAAGGLPRHPRCTGAFSGHCMEVEHDAIPAEELIELLHRNLHGVDIAGNGEEVMVDVEASIGQWHCHE